MSEQQKKCENTIDSSVVMVEKPQGKHRELYRPNELQDDTDHLHKPKTAHVPSVTEDLKHICEDSTSIENDLKELQEFSSAVPISVKQNAAKKVSSRSERRDHSPESIALPTVVVDIKKGVIAPVGQKIPDVKSATSNAEKLAVKDVEEDSITEEIEELRTPEVTKEHSEWSDDEEAGGLPRSESRVSKMVRQLFCCGVSYQAPSEDNVSTHRGFGI